MLQEFQEEIARLKAELAARQAGKSSMPSTAAPQASLPPLWLARALHYSLWAAQPAEQQQSRKMTAAAHGFSSPASFFGRVGQSLQGPILGSRLAAADGGPGWPG